MVLGDPANTVLQLVDIYPCAKFHSNSFTGSLPPKYVKYYAFVTFLLSCPVYTFFLTIAPSSNPWTDFNQIARQLHTQYVEGIYKPNYPVTLKSRLRITQGHWKCNH